MEFMSAKKNIIKRGISKRRVQIFCAEGRVDGVAKVGLVWVVPKNAIKPEDAKIWEASNL